MAITFTPATRAKAKLRMALMGPAKSGKTYTSLKLATELAGPDGTIAVVDTEHGSASKYAGPSDFKFDAVQLENCHPNSFIAAINAAVQGGYAVVIIDSLSAEWTGKGGCLELVDDMSSHSSSKNTFATWKEVTPLHRQVFETINRAPIHVICTFRVKTEYAMVAEEKNGRTINKPQRMGLGPVTRDGAEYEFDILMDMDKGSGYIDHTSRCPELQYLVVKHPGAELAGVIKKWLDGEEIPMSKPVKEEKLTKVNTAPKSKPAEAEARPSVPPTANPSAIKHEEKPPAATVDTAGKVTQSGAAAQTTTTKSAPTDPKSDAAVISTPMASASAAAAGTSTPKLEAATPIAETDDKIGVTRKRCGQMCADVAKCGWKPQQASDFCVALFSLDKTKPLTEQMSENMLLKATDLMRKTAPPEEAPAA